MIYTLKTIPQVTVVERTNKQDYAYMEIADVMYNGEQFVVDINYYYKKAIDTGRVDENNDPIMRIQRMPLPKGLPIKFTLQEAVDIQAYVAGGILSNIYLPGAFNTLVYAGIFYQLSQTLVYGLDHTGWTVVAVPITVPDPTPLPDPNSSPSGGTPEE